MGNVVSSIDKKPHYSGPLEEQVTEKTEEDRIYETKLGSLIKVQFGSIDNFEV